MIQTSKIRLWSLVMGSVFLILGCDDPPQTLTQPAPSVISGKISPQPRIQEKQEKSDPRKNEIPVSEKSPQVIVQARQETEHYDSKGKIDPFESLIQDKPVEPSPADDQPKRVLTPLEKVGLNQLRLVAVILMEKRQLAMVEEASGKGYEVSIGTYIGKNQGRVSEIKESSIVITELVRDFKGRLKERVQEIKLHKIDNEE